MKYCSFNYQGTSSYGFADEQGDIVDIKKLLGVNAPDNLDLFIEQLIAGNINSDQLSAVQTGNHLTIKAEQVSWLPPIGRPGKIMGVAANNKIIQMIAHRPLANPAFFLKPRTSLTGHLQNITVRKDFGVTHPEPELALVIGKGGKHISEQDALKHVFGYSVMNDITSPGLKEKDSIELLVPKSASSAYENLLSWRGNRDEDHARSIYLTYHAFSKGCDDFGPMGPWLVTADEVPDPNNLKIIASDELGPCFEDSTANLTFSIQRIISHASRYCTLETGDIIHCGTALVPVANSRRSSLSEWDISQDAGTMSIDIEGVGCLSNPVIIEA